MYALRSGGSAIWEANIGKGTLINVGVAPGFFTQSETSATLLRGLTQYALQKAGGSYKEPGYLKLTRGKFSIVRTMFASVRIPGRTIDILSPRLDVEANRTVPARSLALLCQLGDQDEDPHIGYVSGRVVAKVETLDLTSYYARGPLGTDGVARFHSGGRHPIGVRALDRLGRDLPIHFNEEGNTLYARYANNPDGVVVRVRWK